MKRRLSVTNLSSENNLPTFRLNDPVVIRAKVKKCEQTLLFVAMHYWGYTSLEVKGRWGPSLHPHHSGPATQSYISVEALLWGCHLDVHAQGLLHQQFLSSAMVQHCGLLPVDRVVILPRMLRYSWLLHHPHLAAISVFLQSCLQSPSSLPAVDLAMAAGDTIHHNVIGLLTKR